MSFPNQTTHLIAQFRASYLTLTDNDEYAKRIIKPLILEDERENEEINGRVLAQLGDQLLHSPPIAFHSSVKKSLNDDDQPSSYHHALMSHKKPNQLHNKKRRSTKRLRPKTIKEESSRSVSNNSTITPPSNEITEQRKTSASSLDTIQNNQSSSHFKFRISPPSQSSLKSPEPIEDNSDGSSKQSNKFGLSYTKTIRGNNKNKKTNSIVKFFQPQQKAKYNNSDSDSDFDSDGSIKTQQDFMTNPKALELIKEENANPPLDYHSEDGESLPSINDNADVLTIDSDFDVPVSETGNVVKTANNNTNEGGPLIRKKFRLSLNNNKNNRIEEIENDDHDESTVENIEQSSKNDGAENNEDSDFEDYSDEDVDEYDDDEDDDEYDDADDTSSTDSAFTDIETDSLIDSSSMLDSYNGVVDNYSFENPTDTVKSFKQTSKRRKQKSNSNTYNGQSLSKTAISSKSFASQNDFLSSTYNNFSTNVNNSNLNNNPKNSQEGFKTQPNSASVTPNKSFVSSQKKNQFVFEKKPIFKPDTDPTPRNSNLSLLIQSRSKSANLNPLQFYSFVDSDIDAENVRKAKINIFVPPNLKPVIIDITMNDNVAIPDCIGYILLSLSKLDDFKYISTSTHYMNPNNWRLELVDEDGENFGSFGILDRVRLLSSYNNPRDLAICKIENNSEIAKNNKITPLPKEFKESLVSFEERQKKFNSILENETTPSKEQNKRSAFEKEETVELKISGVPFGNSRESINFFIPLTSTIENLTSEFCAEYNLESSKYKFRALISDSDDKTNKPHTLLHGTLPDSLASTSIKYRKPLAPTDLVSQLDTQLLELIPADNSHLRVPQQDSLGQDSMLSSGITPSNSLSVPGITPPMKKVMEENSDHIQVDSGKVNPSRFSSNTRTNTNTAESIKRQLKSNKYLEDIITGGDSQIPKSLNDIYMRWKVWRKKPTLLNRIEKSLIIDGDYIHLTPTEDTTWKKNPVDNPFSSSNQTGHGGNTHGHHHHYLHHYNYSNYYNKLMMKTSSFHITQITKLKQYKNSKNPNHFKIVIKKEVENEANVKDNAIKKKYDLEAVSAAECEDIINKIRYVLQVYNMSNMT